MELGSSIFREENALKSDCFVCSICKEFCIGHHHNHVEANRNPLLPWRKIAFPSDHPRAKKRNRFISSWPVFCVLENFSRMVWTLNIQVSDKVRAMPLYFYSFRYKAAIASIRYIAILIAASVIKTNQHDLIFWSKSGGPLKVAGSQHEH